LVSNLGLHPGGPGCPGSNAIFFLFVEHIAYFRPGWFFVVLM
jgi:hypothetical protein